MANSDIRAINRDFYNNTYRENFILRHIIYLFISYNQQAKAKRNIYILKRYLKNIENKKILDYGFGLGSFLLKFSGSCTLYGCDISESAVKLFSKTCKVLFKKPAITVLPDEVAIRFAKVKFDIICLSHILEHVDDDKALLLELKPFLTDEGIFLINVPINEHIVDTNHIRKYNLVSATKLLDQCNLECKFFVSTDKITSYFVLNETKANCSKIKKILFKFLRLILSLMPAALHFKADTMIGEKYLNQQLIIIACRK